MMTPDVCVTPYPNEIPGGVSHWPEFQISAQHPVEIIGGVHFVHGISGEGGMSHSSSVDLYRAFRKKKCFELSLSESGISPQVEDPPLKTLTPRQRRDLDQSFSQVLHSFKFLK